MNSIKILVLSFALFSMSSAMLVKKFHDTSMTNENCKNNHTLDNCYSMRNNSWISGKDCLTRFTSDECAVGRWYFFKNQPFRDNVSCKKSVDSMDIKACLTKFGSKYCFTNRKISPRQFKWMNYETCINKLKEQGCHGGWYYFDKNPNGVRKIASYESVGAIDYVRCFSEFGSNACYTVVDEKWVQIDECRTLIGNCACSATAWFNFKQNPNL